MGSFKVSWGFGSLWLRRFRGALIFFLILAGPTTAESCLAPPRPFVPSDPHVARELADFIRSDFEFYIRDIQGYFRCLEEERARAFEEAREVSEEYRRFLEAVQE